LATAKHAIVCFGLIAPKEQVGWFRRRFCDFGLIPQWSYDQRAGPFCRCGQGCMKMGDGRDGRLAATALGYLLFASIPVWISLSFFCTGEFAR